MLYLTRRERFNAAHRMYIPEWTDDKNLEVFGKCSNPNWHGHNYNLYVTVKGEPHPETSLVVSLKELSRVIREKGHRAPGSPERESGGGFHERKNRLHGEPGNGYLGSARTGGTGAGS